MIRDGLRQAILWELMAAANEAVMEGKPIVFAEVIAGRKAAFWMELEYNPCGVKAAVLEFHNGGQMNLTAFLTDKPAKAVLVERDANGNIVPSAGAVTYSSGDPNIATVDSTTGQLSYVAKGSVQISGRDAGDNLVASGFLTLQASAAASAELDFVLPTAAPVAMPALP